MKNGLILILAVLLAISMLGSDREPRALIEDVHRADYERCVQVHNGPITRDKVKGNWRRRGDLT